MRTNGHGGPANGTPHNGSNGHANGHNRLTPHLNGHSAPPPSEPEEVPSFQFRGVWLPEQVVRLLVSGELTKKEMLLLVLVEALVKGPGDGCWASNAYLAKSVGGSPAYVSEMISSLEKRGLLVVYHKPRGDQPQWRHLETAWSTVREGGTGKPVRARKTAPEPEGEGGPEKSLSPPGGVRKNPEGGVRKNPYQNNLLPTEEGIRENGAALRDGTVCGEDGFLNGPALNGNGTGKAPPSQRAVDLAVKLREGILRQGKAFRRHFNKKESARLLGELASSLSKGRGESVEDSYDYLAALIEDHVEHLKDDYQPQAYGADCFCRKFDEIEYARSKRRKAARKDRSARFQELNKW